jgi:hypothetical protein
LLQQEKIMSDKVLIGVEEFNNITNYLMGRPYREVNQMLEELRQSASVVQVPDEEEQAQINPHDVQPPSFDDAE